MCWMFFSKNASVKCAAACCRTRAVRSGCKTAQRNRPQKKRKQQQKTKRQKRRGKKRSSQAKDSAPKTQPVRAHSHKESNWQRGVWCPAGVPEGRVFHEQEGSRNQCEHHRQAGLLSTPLTASLDCHWEQEPQNNIALKMEKENTFFQYRMHPRNFEICIQKIRTF